MQDFEVGLVDIKTSSGAIGFLIFSSSFAILIVSLLELPATNLLPFDLALVGQNTVAATAAMGMAIMLSERPDTGRIAQMLYLMAIVLAILACIQWAFELYPPDSPVRVLVNTIPASDAWTGRMSHITAAAIFLLASSALLMRVQSIVIATISALVTGMATMIVLGSFSAHIAGLTLFPPAAAGDGTLSLTTSFLLTLIGMAHGGQILNSSAFFEWQLKHPGQGTFIKVMILLAVLFALALGLSAELVLRESYGLALVVLILFFIAGLSVIFRPIVTLVDKSVESERQLRDRETALEQAQSQAQLGSWQMVLPEGDLTWSSESYRIFGLSSVEPITFEDFIAAVHPEDREYVRTSWRHALAGERYDIQHRILVNGSVKWVRERAEVKFDKNNRLVGGMGTVQDITELKLREGQLRISRDEVRRLAAHSEEIRENERTRIAMELHDEMGQQLTVLRMDAALIEKRFAYLSPQLKDRLLDMKQAIDASIGIMRNVVACLRPPALDGGLIVASDSLLDTLQQRSGILCTLIVDGDDVRLDAGRTITVYRVLQESLTNVIRHANASELSVRIAFRDRELSLSVTDNGVGFDPTRVVSCRHFGLMGIRERVLVYGGTTTIDSEPGRGTTLSVIVPVERNSFASEGIDD